MYERQDYTMNYNVYLKLKNDMKKI